MNKEILVVGKGLLGLRLSKFLDCENTDFKISNYGHVQEDIALYKPKVIINCVGSFGKNVDDCEIDKTATLTANTFVPLLLAEASLRNKIKLVHISSSYMFHYNYEDNSPIPETDQPDFFDLFYSRTKIYAEASLMAIAAENDILILRPGPLLDYVSHPDNLLNKLISFKSVTDIPTSITYVPDFLLAIRHLLKLDSRGLFNCTAYGGLRFRDLLEAYRLKIDQNHSYSIVTNSELKIIRPNLILSTDKLEETGFTVRDTKEIIPECVDKWYRISKSETTLKQETDKEKENGEKQSNKR